MKKETGFSKYDNDGRVIYSESINCNGDTIRHYYEYDDLGRRVVYRQRMYDPDFKTGEMDDLLILEELTIYYRDGSSYKSNANFVTGILRETSINNMGREVNIKEFSMDTGYGTEKIWNAYRNTYDIRMTYNAFIPYALPIRYSLCSYFNR